MGMGWMREEFEQTGQDFDSRGKRADEMIPVLRKLWTGDWVEHHGPYYDFDAVRISPVPSEPIPIYIGGHSPAALRRTAEVADGWIGVDYPVEEAEELVRTIRKRLADAGRADVPFELIIALRASLDRDICQRFADLGATGLMVAPWMFIKDASLQARIDSVKRYADEVISKVR
jgi:alkanesulfonate monooxygenase SsuD/methylene tetrahydromethanopterin reductase-like flavin-dependent oxidoreductase (luciferase family)